MEWLEKNDFLSLSILFPAVHFNSGYKILMKSYQEDDLGTVNQYGSIQIESVILINSNLQKNRRI